jgi:hypothetical protein
MRRAVRWIGLAALASCVLGGTGCGYRFVDAAPAAAPGNPAAGRIEIGVFENRSVEAGLERMLTDALLEEFTRRGQLRPVRSGAAGYALSGEVREVRVYPSSVSSISLELENTLEMVLWVELRRGNGRELVWRHEALVLREVYTTSADAQVRDTNKEQAMRRLASELARRIHDELTQTL